MKIVLLVRNDMSVDLRVDRHADALGGHGHDVTVVCTASRQTSLCERRNNYVIQRVPNTAYQFRRSNTRPQATSAPTRVRKQGGARNIIRFFARSFITSFLYPAMLSARFWVAARKLRANIYIANDFDTLLAGALCAGFTRKLWYDSHELWADQYVGTFPLNPYGHPLVIVWMRIVERILVKRCDAVTTVNPFIEMVMRKNFGKAVTSILNVPKHTSPGALPLKRTGRLGQQRVWTVLYQGTYSPLRGLENLITSTCMWRKDVWLVMRGFGSYEPTLRKLAADYPKCLFVPPVSRDEVIKSAQDADVGVIAYEGSNLNNILCSPNKLFEFIQAGIPTIASDLPFLHAIVLGNKIGFVFDPSNPASIAEAVNRATDPEVWKELCTNVERIKGQYIWENEQKKLLAVLYQLSGGNR